ncbi:PP2C family protein-serine/threonine phosphatase [Hymenobacter psychrotolerans]|uniref:Serine phosphatase RsbU, regulator of sigma subunit n=1 Tax=Hymenobacter psychrotolerans DSM 18569 TaxID=1121959 RepID=A0A1M6RR17_9BACT|nr:SpoIIE family protein phosphatase [Hymenobacter psychrotolerans]SHK34922.1 Serine phosphatase RsbU, regulator of sigma subunit [Hymenobacter psychrotolerans DSM 18569]
MSFRHRLKAILFPLSLLSWVLLLLSTLSNTQGNAAGWLGGPWPTWVTLLAQALFAASVFVYQRGRTEPLIGNDFVGMMRRLVLGPGMLATACVGLHLIERVLQYELPTNDRTLFAVIYTINLGLFVVFLANTNYSWRSLVLFRASSRIQREWVWFEVLLGSTLLFRLLDWVPPHPIDYIIMGSLGTFGVYLSGNQQWVAYLSRRQKWEAVLLQIAILLSMAVFVSYFLRIEHDPKLVAPAPQHAFLLLTVFFGAFYAFMGLMVTLFNLPTAGVFEQKREEILSLQRLTQLIQRGQSENEVYGMLFDSAVQTVDADAAWIMLENEAGVREGQSYQVSPEQSAAVRNLLQEHNLHHIEYLNNDLKASSGFRELNLPYGSLIVMPLRSAKRRYGALYMLKQARQGFDRENLSILQTFASQTVLSIENLNLMNVSLENQRVQEELKIASIVQDSLIPKNLPIDSWFDISSYAASAKEVGGDFYDFLHLPGRRLAILIGDVSGKGVTAAFHVAQMKGIFHALMQENPLAKSERDKFPVPSRFMSQANHALARCLEKSAFITASLYIIDYENGGFVFARAGHCHTLYYHSIKEEVSYFQTAGLGLGIIRNESYEKHIKNQFYDYNPGDVMVIYTDGIVEARNAAQQEYGEERLHQMLERTYYLDADEIKQQILEDLGQFSHGQPMHDDQTLLVVKFKSAQPGLNN